MNIDIRKLLSGGERVTLECKKARQNIPGSVWETYSAFANTYGGTILLGVAEHPEETDPARRYEIAGVEDADKIRRDFWNAANSKEKVNTNILRDDDVQIMDVDGRKIVAISVPQASCTARPIYINGNMTGGTFKRNNDGDYHCTEQELKMMMRDANDTGNDGLFLGRYYTMDDIDIPTLERYRMMFQTEHPDHIWNGLGHKDFLTQFGAYALSRTDGTEGLTMAGLLMFGKGLTVRERFDNLRMDFIDKSNLIGEQRYSDRLTYDGTWENNLFNFIRMVIPKLTSALPRPFTMNGVIRNDDTQQHKAVREAVTNMIIHADFMVNGVLKIEKYDDRFVLSNPGLLKLPIEQIYKGGESKSRNQRIQNMFRMIGYGENIGSGFPLILHAWEERKWKMPELSEQPELMQVRLTLFIDKTIHDPKIDPKIDPKLLTARQALIINAISNDCHVTRDKLALMLNLSDSTVKREIAALKEKGVLRREGSAYSGYWVVTTKADGQ